MGRKNQMTMGCRDCKKCSASGMGKAGRGIGRASLAFMTAGLSEAGRVFTRDCGQCGHPLSLHTGSNIQSNLAPQYYPQQPMPQPMPQAQPQPQAQIPQRSPQPKISLADELLKLKQLLDAGALTQQEFDQQKAKLLGN